jgi:hypothetical protein
MIAFVVALILVGAFSWYLVFNEPARLRLQGAHWAFWKRSKEGKELDDALTMAQALIVAVTCSTLLVVVVIIALVQSFK